MIYHFYDDELDDNFVKQPPNKEEGIAAYAQRLTEFGFDESFIRMALGYYFDWNVEQEAEFFENYPEARLRFIELMDSEAPKRTDYSFAKRISKGTGLSNGKAIRWLARYRQRVDEAD